MKQIFVFVVVIITVLHVPSMGIAQIRSMIKDKAIDAAFPGLKRGEKPKDVEVPPQDSVQEQPQSQNTPAQPNFMERKMMAAMGLSSVKYEQKYQYTSSMTMDIVTVDSLGTTEKVVYTTCFNPDGKDFALIFDAKNADSGEKEKGTIIFDSKNSTMLILFEKDGERSGLAMYLTPDSTTAREAEVAEATPDKNETELHHPSYQPTGKTKTIAGSTCHELIYKNDEGSVSLWVSKDRSLNLSNAYNYMNGFQALATAGWGYGQGIVMEMEFREANSSVRSHMTVKDISMSSPRNLDISGYSIVGVGGGN